MHYRSTHSLLCVSHTKNTCTHIHSASFSSFIHRISTHTHAPHHKWWDLNINSMKYSCVSASRSSRTTTKGDLPSDLRIPLHSSPSLSSSSYSPAPFFPPVVLQHPEPSSCSLAPEFCCIFDIILTRSGVMSGSARLREGQRWDASNFSLVHSKCRKVRQKSGRREWSYCRGEDGGVCFTTLCHVNRENFWQTRRLLPSPLWLK